MTCARSFTGGQVFDWDRAAQPAAMHPDLSDKEWVSQVDLHWPLDCTELAVSPTPVQKNQSWRVSRRWWRAYKEEIRKWRKEKPHTIDEVMDIVTRDMAVAPNFEPARCTTMVEGRPVQAQRFNQNTI